MGAVQRITHFATAFFPASDFRNARAASRARTFSLNKSAPGGGWSRPAASRLGPMQSQAARAPF